MATVTQTPKISMPECFTMGMMKLPLLYVNPLEALNTSTTLIIQRKKNTIQMTLSPLNILPIFLFML